MNIMASADVNTPAFACAERIDGSNFRSKCEKRICDAQDYISEICIYRFRSIVYGNNNGIF